MIHRILKSKSKCLARQLGMTFLAGMLLFCTSDIFAREISKSFEFRYVSPDSKANGETDFKGKTAVFDTDQRVSYLKHWAEYGKRFFDDPGLDTKIVKDAEIESALKKLKPQPRPEVRKEVPIRNWKYLGYREGQHIEESEQIKEWDSLQGVEVRNGVLVLEDTEIRRSFEPQSWRSRFEWKAQVPAEGKSADFNIYDAVSFGFESDGTLYYIVDGEKKRGDEYKNGSWHRFKVDLDLDSADGRFNLVVDDEKVADFVPLSGKPKSFSSLPPSHFGENDSYLAFIEKGQYMDVGTDGLSPREGTVELWFNLRKKGRGGDDAPFLFSHVAPRDKWANRICMRHGEGDGFSIRLGESELVKNIFHPEVGQWHHVALTWKEGNYAVYVDGEIKKQGTYNGLEKIADLATLGNAGREDQRDYTPRAYIDELCIWDHAREKEQIRAHGDQRLRGNEGGLIGYWPLTGGKGEVAEDASGHGNNGRIRNPVWHGQDAKMPAVVDTFKAGTDGELELDDLCITSFGEGANEGDRETPYRINTIVDQHFEVTPDPKGFEKANYDDSQWNIVPYRRYAHGGERNAGEYLYLRKSVQVEDFERAVLDVETVRPAGVLYVNGKKIRKLDRYPKRLDLSDVLRPNRKNLIAVRIDPHDVGTPRYHMSVDTHSSWFAGLMRLELTDSVFIDDVFAYATEVGDPANLRVKVKADSKEKTPFNGEIVVQAIPWYPDEDQESVSTASTPITVDGKTTQIVDVSIPDPNLWTTDNPNLYKVRVLVKDQTGKAVDDKVFTTGLRTVSQEGGTFRVNREPSMLNGPLIFGHHDPLERIAQWMFSPPREKWIQDILMTRKMNGNVLRMSVHDKRVAGIQDRRLAEIADQLGIMLIWQTPAWVRVGSTADFDFEGLSKYSEAVRNHPSIVMWQPGNHPSNYSPEWYGRIVETLAAVDPSRMISPAADMDKMKMKEWPEDDSDQIPNWTHPQLARGNMEQSTAYGKDWTVVRQLGTGVDKKVSDCNDRARVEYLNSDTHAWFDFESEETIAQPNWRLHRGQPYYRMYSYEKNYDKGSIGRVLKLDEWQESQAWQALTVIEAYRKKRWLGYDGTNWCPLHGGGNTATYMKPILDYRGYAKLAYHAMRMVYQPVLAGSKNVDIVYGPEDDIPVMVLNMGDAKTVDVQVVARDMEGRIVDRIHYGNVELAKGRTVTDLPVWQPDLESGQSYGFEYSVQIDE